jgi:hypothetical protein
MGVELPVVPEFLFWFPYAVIPVSFYPDTTRPEKRDLPICETNKASTVRIFSHAYSIYA